MNKLSTFLKSGKFKIIVIAIILIFGYGYFTYQNIKLDYIPENEMKEIFSNVKGSDVSFMRIQREESLIVPQFRIFLYDKSNNIKTQKLINKDLGDTTLTFHSFNDIHVIDIQTNNVTKRELYLLNENGIKKFASYDGLPIYVNISNKYIFVTVQNFLAGKYSFNIDSYDLNGSLQKKSEELHYVMDKNQVYKDSLYFIGLKLDNKLNTLSSIIAKYDFDNGFIIEPNEIMRSRNIRVKDGISYVVKQKNNDLNNYLDVYDKEFKLISSNKINLEDIIGVVNDHEIIGETKNSLDLIDISTQKIISSVDISNRKNLSITSSGDKVFLFDNKTVDIYDMSTLKLLKFGNSDFQSSIDKTNSLNYFVDLSQSYR